MPEFIDAFPCLRRVNLKLDQAFEFAVILAWEDLIKVSDPRSVRVEYRCEPGTPLDHVSVWSTGADRYQKLVCDYWASASLRHNGGATFWNGYRSVQLTTILDLIMTNQKRFARSKHACGDGLALIYPPTAADRAEAGIWLREMHGTHPDFSNSARSQWPPRSQMVSHFDQGGVQN